MLTSLSPPDHQLDDIDGPVVAPSRHPGRWVVVVVATLLAAMVVNSVARNKAFQWSVVGQYFATSSVLHGLLLTLWLTAAVMALGFVVGSVLAAMRLSTNPLLRSLAWGYVWLFRSVPPLVQLLFWYNIGALYPKLSIGIPFGTEFASVKTVNLISPIVAAIIGLTLQEAAVASEILRGGILSVDRGQAEAAQALGLSRFRIFRRIVLPQAMRAIVPAAANSVITTVKATSLVSVIAVEDLLYSVQIIYNRTYQIIPLLLVATIWYIIVISLLTIGQFYVERRYARGHDRTSPVSPWARLRRLPRRLDRAAAR